MRAPLLLALALSLAAPAPARADQDYFGSNQGQPPITYRVSKPRSNRTRVLIASLAGGGLVASGLGVYFHLQSRDLSDQVSASSGQLTGLTWTAELDQVRSDALSNRTAAIASYSVGGALLLGAAAVFIFTEPGEQMYEVREPAPPAIPVVVPIKGGAALGVQVSF